MAALLALAAAGVFGAADFVGGFSARSSPARSVALLAYIAGAVATALALLIFGGAWSWSAVIWGGAAGIAGMVGLVLLFTGFARGTFQVVSPAAAVMSGVVPVAWGLVSGEQPGALAVVGLAIAPLGIWLLAGGTLSVPAARDRDSLIFGLGAGVGFGVFFTCLAQSPDDALLVPLLAARATSIGGLLVISAVLGGPLLPPVRKLPAIASGLLDPVANGLFLVASQSGDLFVVGALVALFPASNALLARIVLGERLKPVQRVGFVVALAAGAALAV